MHFRPTELFPLICMYLCYDPGNWTVCTEHYPGLPGDSSSVVAFCLVATFLLVGLLRAVPGQVGLPARKAKYLGPFTIQHEPRSTEQHIVHVDFCLFTRISHKGSPKELPNRGLGRGHLRLPLSHPKNESEQHSWPFLFALSFLFEC